MIFYWGRLIAFLRLHTDILSLGLLLVAFNILDMISTFAVVRRGAEEANPLVRLILDYPVIAYGVKVLVPSIVVGLMLVMIRVNDTVKPHVRVWLVALIIFYAIISCNNLYNYIQLR